MKDLNKRKGWTGERPWSATFTQTKELEAMYQEALSEPLNHELIQLVTTRCFRLMQAEPVRPEFNGSRLEVDCIIGRVGTSLLKEIENTSMKLNP